jgi:hypothetical protein
VATKASKNALASPRVRDRVKTEIERGPLYEFFLNHVVHVDKPDELSRTTLTEIGS